MKRVRLRIENHGPVKVGRDPSYAALHLAIPSLKISAIGIVPLLVQIDQKIDPTSPGAMVRVHGEIRMNGQEPATGGGVQASALQTGIRKQTFDAGQV